jgi:hypothetical protein
MGASFKRTRKGNVKLRIDDDEREVLRDLLGQVAELVADHDSAVSTEADPLSAMLGIGTSTTAPEDPALARLFPDAYSDDPQAAGDFRRYTELSLRRRKTENAAVALRTLEQDSPVRLEPSDVSAWLGALNDLRLVIGTRLGVGDDEVGEPDEPIEMDDEGPEAWSRMLYHWLTWLQGDLLEAVDSGPG